MNPMVCAGCGAWAARPAVRDGCWVCASCGHLEPWRTPPVHVLTGPSGTGKSTVGRLLQVKLAGRAQVLEQDVLWVDGLRETAAFRGTWLRMLAMLNQAGGPPVLLCGTVVPPEFDTLPERALLGEIRYLALVCEPSVLRARLSARPAWRGWDDERRIVEMLEFDGWLRANAAAMGVDLVDTTSVAADETATVVADWFRR
jgi:hypothetical protein